MTHTTALQLSILVALGIVPVACGGTTKNGGDNGGSGGNDTAGGTTVLGGTTGRAGSSGKGGDGKGGTAQGGAPSLGGFGVGAEGGGINRNVCSHPTVDPDTGLVSCDEGYVHRPVAVACNHAAGGESGAASDGNGSGGGDDTPLPRADGSLPCGDDPNVCNQFEHGFCNDHFEGGGPPYRTCYSGCVIDANCGVGQVCTCDNPASPTGGACRAAACQTDQDCGTLSLCASYQQACGSSGFACVTRFDECFTNADCPMLANCTWEPDATRPNGYRRACTNSVCGRPFLVLTEPRLPPITARSDWNGSAQPATDHLTLTERAALAAHWTRMGQMEHASIAAFARFSLQLLSLGAPPDLVDACTQALADETAHTKLCFALASAYAGRALGPGPLDVSGSLAVTSLADIVDLVIAEGCFGETGAALEALEAAQSATDPVIIAAYSQIARDEQRHAELAFRFVRWALARDGETVAARIHAALRVPATATAHAVALPCLEALLQSTGHAMKYAAA